LQAIGARRLLVAELQRGRARCQGNAVVHLGAVADGVPGIAGGAELDGVGQAPARGQGEARRRPAASCKIIIH
jgi:hypothetical protein